MGNTGGPGETTCQKSGCHSGGNFTGSVALSGIPDTILPNTTYPLTLTLTSNCSKSGFQLTCLDASNTKMGNLTTGSGVNIGNSNNRQYARQSTPKSLSGGAASWTFSWKSPATPSGNTANFYFTALCCNGTGNDNGDNVVKSSKTVVYANTVATTEPESAWYDFSFSCVSNTLRLDLKNSDKGRIMIQNAGGKLVLSEKLQENNIFALENLSPGLYLAMIESNGKTAVHKIIIN